MQTWLRGWWPARTRRVGRAFQRPLARRPVASHLEELESRLLLAAYTPAQISHAYGFDQIMFGDVQGDGTGQTIAIVNAYNAPNIQSDLATFNALYGLPTSDGDGGALLTIANPQGQPTYDANWAKETTLDVQWAHAMAPGAHILLVQARSNSVDDLMAAVNYARNQPGVSVISMSWGAAEFAGMTSYNSTFTTPAGHQGVSFVASAGNTATIAQFPAMSGNVLAVGGTTLVTSDTAGTYSVETAWSKSGGGISQYETKPPQQDEITQSSTQRTGPDVAYVADPATGVRVYFTPSGGTGSWMTVGGTSAGAPQWAALVAIANQGRALNGEGSLDGKTQLLPAIYNMSAANFNDIVSGTTTNGSTSYTAGPGYDLITGRGSPRAALVVRDLVLAEADGTIGALADPPELGSVAVSSQTGALTYGSAGTATYVVTVSRAAGTTGSFDVALGLTSGLPAGATFSFTVGGTTTNVLHFGANDTTLTATLTVSTASKSPAGSFTVTVRGDQVAGSTSTGDFATAAGTLAISKRALTASALAQSKVYDGTTAAVVSLSDNRVAGDALTVTYGTANFGSKNVGTGKVVNVAGIAISGADAANYVVNATTSATANVTPRPITVTADAKTKLEGAADPPLTYQVTSGALVAGDSFAGALARAAGESPGAYAIQQGTLAAANYNVTFVGNSLTIVANSTSQIGLAGPWVVNGAWAQMTQSGNTLSLVDETGVNSTGSFVSSNQITGRGGLTGTVDTSTPDNGRIVWSDGVVWLRLALGGQYYNPINNALTSVVQTGTNLTFVNAAGGTSAGGFTNATTLSATGFGLTATISNAGITFSNGAVWKKLNLSPAYSVAGGATGVVQNGTTNLVFVNRLGGTSPGYWISPTAVSATDWGLSGTVSNGAITWSNGAVWSKDLQVAGSANGSNVSLLATGAQIFATNKLGNSSRIQVTAPNSLTLLDWGLTAQVLDGSLVFSNGVTWNNFDFNALDAVFSDVKSFPFGG
ncbi:MAG: MBG domain-containing protein [Planctomycetaceae bacterium]